MSRCMNRRSVLAGLGVAGVSGWAGYAHFQSGQEGQVFWREMAVDAGGEPGSLRVLTEWRAHDGIVERAIHPEYEEAFDNGAYVSKDLHQALKREFGADEPYYIIRYEGHDCNGIPGDEGDNAVEVSRIEFNRLQVGDCVKK